MRLIVANSVAKSNIMKTITIMLLQLGCCFVCKSQDSTHEKSSFRVGFQTSTVPVNDITASDSFRLQLFIAPQVSYFHKTGLEITARTYFLTGRFSGNFLTTISPGYEKDNEKLYGAVNYTHFFYKSAAVVPYSPIKNELYSSLRLKKKMLQPLLTVNAGWGKDSAGGTAFDINLLAGLAHEFALDIKNAGTISFLPAIILNAGTNNYFSLLKGSPYIGNSKNVNALIHSQSHARGRGNAGSNLNTASTTDAHSLALTQLEGNLYLYYSVGRFVIEPDLSIFFPLQSGNHTAGFFQLTANLKL